MVTGKTIQIYIPDGNPRNIRLAEITTRTIQTVVVPRASLDYAASRNELNSVGIYFLIGNPENEALPLIYIGEAEDCIARLKQHNKSKTKDFWNVAVVILSKTQFFTKTHIKFLESHCYSETVKAGRYKVKNTTAPSTPFVPEPMKMDLLENFDTIKILVSTLGYPVFDIVDTKNKAEQLICRGKEALATGQYMEEGLVVLKGSRCNVEETSTINSSASNMRQKLINDGILVKKGNVYEFTGDYVFASPSMAAATVLARSAN
jgi:hypothetical protein